MVKNIINDDYLWSITLMQLILRIIQITVKCFASYCYCFHSKENCNYHRIVLDISVTPPLKLISCRDNLIGKHGFFYHVLNIFDYFRQYYCDLISTYSPLCPTFKQQTQKVNFRTQKLTVSTKKVYKSRCNKQALPYQHSQSM